MPDRRSHRSFGRKTGALPAGVYAAEPAAAGAPFPSRPRSCDTLSCADDLWPPAERGPHAFHDRSDTDLSVATVLPRVVVVVLSCPATLYYYPFTSVSSIRAEHVVEQ